MSDRKKHSHEHKKFRVLIWNDTINKVFMGFLIVTILILVGLTYVQNIYIHQLEHKVATQGDLDSINYEIVPLEDFNIDEGYAGSIADLNVHLLRNGFGNIIVQKGFIQAEKKDCDDEGCIKTTFRFNQRKGKYVEFIYENVN